MSNLPQPYKPPSDGRTGHTEFMLSLMAQDPKAAHKVVEDPDAPLELRLKAAKLTIAQKASIPPHTMGRAPYRGKPHPCECADCL